MESPQENGMVSIKTLNIIKYGAGVNETSEDQVYTADPSTIAGPLTPQPESPVAEIGFVATTPTHQVQDHPLASVVGATGVQGVVNTSEYQQQPLATPRPEDVCSAPSTSTTRSPAPPPPTASTPMIRVKVSEFLIMLHYFVLSSFHRKGILLAML